MRTCSALFALFAVAPLTVAAELRFEGLERLYFERVEMERAAWKHAAELTALLPPQLEAPQPALAASEDESEFSVRDIELPLAGIDGKLWLREVEDARHPRISQLWWALYQDGEQREVWFYSALPARTEAKLLGNYAIESMRAPSADALLMRLRSRMLRPGGAWWIAGRELAFDVRGARITLTRVHTPWAYTHGYDTDVGEGRLTVATEQEREHGFALRRRDHVRADQVAACGLADPEATTDSTQSWPTLANVAQCLTADANATTSTRAFDEASFAERERDE